MEQLKAINEPNDLLERRRFLMHSLTGIAGVAGLTTNVFAADTPASSTPDFFPEFERKVIKTSGADIFARIGGNGPALLMLHGYPETHLAWRKVAPALSQKFTLVIPDLRGYGDSSKPEGGPGHVNYSKRAMALDQIETMQQLGFAKFSVLSHDRGSRVAYRLAMDHPELINKLVLMDVLPAEYMYRTVNSKLATAYWHWFFLTQPAPFPETLISNGADSYLKSAMKNLIAKGLEPAIFGEYLRCLTNNGTPRGICEDYRAGATIDITQELADKGKKLSVPLLALWGGEGIIGKQYDVLNVWRQYADQVEGTAMTSNHWIAEEAPEQLLSEVLRFLP